MDDVRDESGERQTMSMQFPVLCWDCEVKLTDGDVRELVQLQVEHAGTVGEPAVKLRRIVRLVCGPCARWHDGRPVVS